MLKSTFSPMFSSLPAKIKRSITSPSSKPMKIAPSHTHPPSVRRNASTNSEVYHLNLPPPTSAYVHLPFCRKRCHYCDFPIVALGSSSSSASSNQTNREDFEDPRMVNYIDLLCREIAATAKTRSSGADTVPLETVFFGGGTPSLVPPRLVESVMEALNSNFGLSSFPEAEVSMEMDPGTFDAERVKRFMGLGVNRVSLGIQAFQDELLKSCGRSHGIEEVREAVEIVRSCGVRNWSVDLISSLPRQTPEMWEQSLTLALDAGPTHVSVYDLQIEQGTKFGSLYTPGEFPLPSDSQSAEYYKTASRMLGEAGFEHYEISSYCKTGFECKHNQVYWKNVPFYAFGLGSASFIGGLRFSRPKSMRGYVDFVENLENGTVNWDKNDHIDSKDIASDVIMLSLRTSRGINLRDFDKEFGSSLVRSLCDAFSDYVQSGHVVPLDEKRKVLSLDEFERVLGSEDESGIGNKIAYLRLSDPDGFLLSNEIISHAFRVISP